MASPWRGLIDLLLKCLLAYYALRFLRKNFMPPPTAQAGSSPSVYQNAWSPGDTFDLLVYVSGEAEPRSLRREDLVWQQDGLQFGGSGLFYRSAEMMVGLRGRRPVDLFAHVYLVKKKQSAGTEAAAVLYKRTRLGGVMKRKREKKVGNLLVSQEDNLLTEEQQQQVEYWYPELDISIVNDPSTYDLAVLHPLALPHMTVDRQTQRYHPILYLNDFWHIKERRLVLHPDRIASGELPLRLSFGPISLFKFQMLVSFDHSFRLNEALFDADGGIGGIDSIKESLLNTKPWILFLTLIVTVLHALFDLLAFKNDIQFWRKQEDLTGLSTRSILLSVLSQLIIFLYLLEQNTSFLVLGSTAVGLLIEVWKVSRAMHLQVGWSRLGLPYPIFRDRASYEGKTKELDDRAMWYLSLVALPLLAGYAIYSLLYESHASLYSYLLSTLVGFVYAFGFIMMTPQLFINYKLKSVAHLPWRVFIYKSLNTFIDDLFAFIIKMPLLHRIACFRDDLVFLVYLYQQWIYPVDKARVNEFGQTFQDDADSRKEVESDKCVAEQEPLGSSKVATKVTRRRIK